MPFVNRESVDEECVEDDCNSSCGGTASRSVGGDGDSIDDTSSRISSVSSIGVGSHFEATMSTTSAASGVVSLDGSSGYWSSSRQGDGHGQVVTLSYPRQNSLSSVLPCPSKVRASLAAYAAHRNNEMASYAALARHATSCPEFQNLLLTVFLRCVSDPRRLPFLVQFFKGDDDLLVSSTSSSNDAGCVRLLLYLEILAYEDLWEVTPPAKRGDHARKVIQKFLGGEPVFDLRSALPPPVTSDLTELLISPESSSEKMPPPPPHDLFAPVKATLEGYLSRTRFASFLLSDDCARMRAYLRNTPPRIRIPVTLVIEGAVSSEYDSSGNHRGTGTSPSVMLYHVLNALGAVKSQQVEGQSTSISSPPLCCPGGLCAVLFLRREWKRAVSHYRSTGEGGEELLRLAEHLWCIFLAPGGGMLDSSPSTSSRHSNDCYVVLNTVRRQIVAAVTSSTAESVAALAGDELNASLESLSRELLFDYTVTTHRQFEERNSVCYEMLCKEFQKGGGRLGEGCVERLLRGVYLPACISVHRPERDEEDCRSTATADTESSEDLADVEKAHVASSVEVTDGHNICSGEKVDQQRLPLQESYHNADYAIVFGTCDDNDENESDDSSSAQSAKASAAPTPDSTLRLLATLSLVSPTTSETSIPPTLLSYASVPLSSKRRDCYKRRDTCGISQQSDVACSDDGWDVSLVNFVVPNACDVIYGVSLVFHRIEDSISGSKDLNQQQGKDASDESKPTATGDKSKIISISSGAASDNKCPNNLCGLWTDKSRRDGDTIGITLISSRNVIPAMRATLSHLYHTHSQSINGNDDTSPLSSKQHHLAEPLINILGSLSNQCTHSTFINNLMPHLKHGITPWLSAPSFHTQQLHFTSQSALHLLQSLPPVPLSLLFLTALLERKIVLTSHRRSLLLSAATGLQSLLAPILRWSHLYVPFVPDQFVRDIVQYPAPFMIGVVREENESVLNSLPSDVTLVDLDMGKVVLPMGCSNAALEVSTASGGNWGDLRCQMLRLAEILGSFVGEQVYGGAWGCDYVFGDDTTERNGGNGSWEAVHSICQKFIRELLAGTNSCCFWVEDKRHGEDKTENNYTDKNKDSSVLFDESRFYHIKNLRAQGLYMPLFKNDESTYLTADTSLALNTDEFGAILETFLRSQAMSTYTSSRPKTSMAYW